MEMPFGPKAVANALAAVSHAGPPASPMGAAAVVARLRKSVAWSNRRLLALTGLVEASAAVADSPTLVVDRRGLTRVVGTIMEHTTGKRSPLVLASQAVILRSLMRTATGIWNVADPGRVLVAPNVLSDARRYALDQSDWCKWVSLTTGLRGVHLTHAPFLIPYIADLMHHLPARSDDLVRVVLLLDALPTAQMDALTPRDLPSVQWLRERRANIGGVALVHACQGAGVPLTGVAQIHAQTEGFARAVVHEGALEVLLSSLDALPTAAEYEDPRLWLARVR